MDILVDIRQKLLSGKQPIEWVKDGYAQSSVYSVAKKVRNTQSGILGLPVDDELTELRRRKEIIKLQKEIAELKAAKERLPDRVAKLEAEVHRLNQQLPDLVANCYASLYMVILCKHGRNKDEALEKAKSIGNDFLKHFGAYP